jgi:hypothetical protein
MDYHGGLAPLYIEQRGLPPIPTAVTLHNALHQVAGLGPRALPPLPSAVCSLVRPSALTRLAATTTASTILPVGIAALDAKCFRVETPESNYLSRVG